MRRWTSAAIVLAVLVCRGEDAPSAPDAPGLDERGLLTLDGLGVLATYGMDETVGPEAILQKPMDATFLGDHVLILDASATGDIPAVYLLEGRALLAAIDAYGTP